MIITSILLLHFSQQQSLPPADPRDLAEAQAHGWIIRESTDAQSGIGMRFFVSSDGRRQGPFHSWYKSGRIRSTSRYSNGERFGPAQWWYETGKPWKAGSFQGDQMSGRWTIWSENGTKSSEGSYKKDLPDGTWSFTYPNGRPAARGSYDHALQNGKWTFWNQDGSIKAAGTFFDGYLARNGRKPEIARIVPPEAPGSGPPARLDVRVDPRMELLAVIQSFTDWAGWGVFDQTGSQYHHDVTAWFGRFKGHGAVQLLNKMLHGNPSFSFDAPVNWILHYGDPPDLPAKGVVPGSIEIRGGGKAQIESLAEAFRQFARETKFDEFFREHRPFYDSLIRDYRQLSPGERALKLVQDYYGERKSAATVIVAPLFGGGNYGPLIQEPDGPHIYNVGAPQLFREGKYGFDRDVLQSLIYHEFGHSFTNPAVDGFAEKDKHASELFPLVRDKMAAMAYSNWRSTLYELFVRTNEIHLTALDGNPSYARDMLGSYVSKGFVWLPYTISLLQEFDRDRKRYPTFRDFLPRLFQVFEETEPFVVDGNLICVLPKG